VTFRPNRQDDFSPLWLAADHDVDSQPLVDFHEITTADRARSGGSPKSESSCEADEVYRPVNFIPDEVHELIRIWEFACIWQKETTDPVDPMDIESVTNLQGKENGFEQIRCMTESAIPPKRFHRAFWRSLTRRVVQRMKASDLS
jgi:hypothetical protein